MVPIKWVPYPQKEYEYCRMTHCLSSPCLKSGQETWVNYKHLKENGRLYYKKRGQGNQTDYKDPRKMVGKTIRVVKKVEQTTHTLRKEYARP